MAWTQETATAFARKHGVDLSSSGGIAQGGVLDRAVAANPQLRQAYTQAINAANAVSPNTPTTGARPVGIEPLHQFEKEM